MKKPLNSTKIKLSSNKRYLSANGSSLLPLALRPRLFLIVLFLTFGIASLFNSNSVFAASITLTIPKDSISLTVNPNKDSGFAKSSPQTISVTTDDPAGYNLTIKARYDSDNTLKNGSNVLNSISKTTSEADYKSDISLNNTWGFLPSKLFNLETASTSDNTNFIPGPTTDPLIIDKTSGSNNDAPNSYDISIGAKVDNSLVSGTYSNTFIISATTNTLPKMQDFATMTKEKYDETLESMKLNEQYEYVDERDDKVYYVSKLADGNVWMTENLDFDLSTEKQLTPNDTDVPSNWTPSTSTTTSFSWDKGNSTTPQSHNPGDRCWDGTIESSNNTKTLEQGTIVCKQHDSSHYHIGNYYSWPAVIAMNDTSNYTTDKEDLNQSICPAGWRLSTYEEISLGKISLI